MASLYQLLINQNPHETRVVYLSNAPETIVGIPALEFSHKTFLSYNSFPPGDLDLRESIFDNNHKIDEIRRLILQERPDVLIMIGDNGERDAEIYHTATQEFGTKIRMHSFIHQLYATSAPFYIPDFLAELGKKIFPEQVGYVTAIELATELKARGELSQASYDWMMRNVAPAIANETIFKFDTIGSISFPKFMNCSDFVWRWKLTKELLPVYDKIKKTCQ